MPEITTSDGVRLNYLDQGSGPVVLLIAGFTAPATSWLFQTPPLLAAGRRVIALDRRGHGASDDPPFGARMARHGKDLADALRALDLEDVVLVGGSMGASTIWAYADLFGAERVRGVVTVDQTPKMLNADGWNHGFYGLTRENLGTYLEHGVPATGRGIPIGQKGPEVLGRLLQAAGRTPEQLAAPPSFSAQAMALLQDHAEQDWRDVVARLEAPALLVAARDSELWPCEHAEAAAAANPRARSAVVEDCGHAANIERPDEFNRLLLDFVHSL